MAPAIPARRLRHVVTDHLLEESTHRTPELGVPDARWAVSPIDATRRVHLRPRAPAVRWSGKVDSSRSRATVMAGSVASRASRIADPGRQHRRVESQLPGVAAYSHCRPAAP